MAATVNVNFLTVVHASSSGVVMGFPDVCKTPSPGGPIPIPYPNIAKSSDTTQGSTTVKMDGNPIMLKQSVFATSTGDEGGTAGGGVVSNTIKGKAEFVLYSFDVKVEGKNVCRLTDIMVLNKMSSPNTPPFPEVQPPLVVLPTMMSEDEDKPAEIGLFNLRQ
jgi:Toxin PAAR-like domain